MGSTSKEPTTVKFTNPVLLGFAVEVKLYCPTFTWPEALKLVAKGINAVVNWPPAPSFNVNAAEPLELKSIGLRLAPLVPI